MSLTPEQIEEQRYRLQTHIRAWMPGQCNLLSDPDCSCCLCVVDDLVRGALSAARKDKALRELVRLKDLRQKIVDNTDKILAMPTGVQDYAFAVRAQAVAETLAWTEARAAVEQEPT